jgi:hypothetical protein
MQQNKPNKNDFENQTNKNHNPYIIIQQTIFLNKTPFKITADWQKTTVNLLITRCINKFNIQQLYVLPKLYLCVV